VEVVANEKEAFWPSDASEVATTLPPPLPSPKAMAVAPKAMNTSSTAIPAAERDDNTPSESTASKKDTTEVSCVPFHLSNSKSHVLANSPFSSCTLCNCVISNVLPCKHACHWIHRLLLLLLKPKGKREEAAAVYPVTKTKEVQAPNV
jgi:hypothetical protein